MDFRKPLAWFARKIIAKYNPLVIGITGSVGKTSTRHAIASVLAAKYSVREPIKNYNNEFGIPLTIIGARGLDEGGGYFGWLRIFAHAARVLWLPGEYPKIAVLEYGIDHPGDMDGLLKIVQPEIAVLTTIGISHKAHFNTEAEIAYEKGKMAASLPVNGTFIYNSDDVNVTEQTKRTSAETISYGVENDAHVKLIAVEEQLRLNAQSTLHIQTPTRKISVTVPVVGKGHSAGVVAAVAVAEKLEMESDLILKGLANYRPVPGRLNIIAGIKRTILIDDTYNASPASMHEALQVLHRFPGNNKVAILGDMLELGDLAEQSHRDIGKLVAKLNIDTLVTVGELAAIITESAVPNGFNNGKIVSFANSDKAKSAVLDMLESGSVILIKGSQSIRMEKITKELLAEPMSAHNVLCRQYGKWLQS